MTSTRCPFRANQSITRPFVTRNVINCPTLADLLAILSSLREIILFAVQIPGESSLQVDRVAEQRNY